MIEDWRQDYNHHRPHSALGMKAPAFARTWSDRQPCPRLAPLALRAPSARRGTTTLHTSNNHRLSQQVDR